MKLNGPVLPRSEWSMGTGSWAVVFVPACFACALVSFMTTMISAIADAQHTRQPDGIILGSFGLALWLCTCPLSFLSWLRAAFTDPGRPPAPSSHVYGTMKKENEYEQNDDDEIDDENDLEKAAVVCERCALVKPERARHCSISRRCVKRFDHYCPWINNCVGYENHAHFYRFTFWTMLLCSISIAMLVLRIWIRDERWTLQPIDGAGAPAAFLCLMGGSFTLSMCFMHTQLLASNRTTLEHTLIMNRMFRERNRHYENAKRARHGESPLPEPPVLYEDLYDLGCAANCDSILGSRRLLWLCPLANTAMLHDGIHWPRNPNPTPIVFRPFSFQVK
jgi:DHHC palmitoyltransferase